MRWDIDKELARLGGSPLIHQALIAEEVASEPKKVWVIVLGTFSFSGKTIHEAFLDLRRKLKKASPEQLAAEGLTKPRKRSNSYASARRKKKAKTK